MKRTIVAILSCCFIIFLTSGASAQTERWKIGHVRPVGSSVDKDIKAFVEQIETGSKDQIQIDIYPASKLGDYSVVQERVSFGEVEMFVGPFGTSVDKRLALAFTPFLVSDWDQARKVYSHDSPLLTEMSTLLEPQNIKLIGGWPVYFGGLALTAEPPEPGDPASPKKMIIRVPPIRCFQLTAKQLGYTPYPITWTYAKMGLKTGMVEGILGGGAEGYLGLAGIVKYYLPLKDHFEYWFVYMNLELWNGLSDQDRNLIADAARAMETQRYQVAQDEENENIAKLAQKGVKVIDFTETERAAMQAQIRKMVWPQMRQDIGEVFDRIVGQLNPQ